MMDLETIRYMSRKRARESAARKVVPLIIEQEDIDGGVENIRGIPNLGDRCPRGWKRVKLDEAFEPNRHAVYMGDNHNFGAYFVDSGWGGDDGIAMSVNTLLKRLKAGYGYAIVEEGEFQVKVGVFQKKATE
jgi:hypothetical protein